MAQFMLADQRHPEDQNLHCLDSILQILNYCSEIRLLIMNTNEPICEEVSRIFEGESSSSTCLRLILRSLNEEASYLYHQNQDIFKVLQIVYKSLENEISEEKRQILNRLNNFKEESVTNKTLGISELMNNLNDYPKYLILKLDSLMKIPESLIKIKKKVKRMKRIRVLTGETYSLKAITMIDSKTDKYKTEVVQEQPMIQLKDRMHKKLHRDAAKHSKGYLLLYTKNTKETYETKQEFHCNVDGCPLEQKLNSHEALKEHIEFEHPTCNVCKEVFLLNCLYKEHTKYKYCELTQTSLNNKQSECKTEKKEIEEEFRSKDITRKRKYTCIEVKSNLTNEVQIFIERQMKVKKEGINDLNLNISFDENVTKISVNLMQV